MSFLKCDKYEKDIKKCLEYVLSKCQIGNPYFFGEFIKESKALQRPRIHGWVLFLVSLSSYLFLLKDKAMTISGKRVAYILPKEMGFSDETFTGDWAL